MRSNSEKRVFKFYPEGVLIGLLDGATKICLYLSVLSLFLMVVAFVYEVGVRYFFNLSTSWSYDFSTWCLAVGIMTALPEVTRRNANISIDFILMKLPLPARKTIRIVVFVMSGMFCLAVAGLCFEESWHQFSQQIETMWITPVPKWLVSIVIPIGFSLSGLHFFRSIAATRKLGNLVEGESS